MFADKVDRKSHEQVMMSVVGFAANNIVDLMNLEKEAAGAAKNLKIQKEGGFVNVTNLTEMEVQSLDFFVNSMMYCRNYKVLY